MCKILEKKNQLPVSDQADAIVFTLQQVLEAIELYLDQVRDPVSYPQLSIIGYTLPPPPTFPNSNELCVELCFLCQRHKFAEY